MAIATLTVMFAATIFGGVYSADAAVQYANGGYAKNTAYASQSNYVYSGSATQTNTATQVADASANNNIDCGCVGSYTYQSASGGSATNYANAYQTNQVGSYNYYPSTQTNTATQVADASGNNNIGSP